MNIGQVKSEIKNLAFEENGSMQEYKEIVNEAINRAIQEIHSTARPILNHFEIRQTEQKEGPIRYDLKELTRENGTVVFMDLADPLEWTQPDGTYHQNTGRLVVNRSILLLDGEKTGTYTVWFKRIPKHIAEETADSEELELDYDMHALVPLLAAYYVWLDDDERKATMYHNKYDDLKTQIMGNAQGKPSAELTGGVGW